MSRIDAVYRRGVFEPLEPVNLCDEQRVRLSYEPANGESAQAWLSQVKAMQSTIVERVGVLPDSAADIASDRMR